MRTICGVVGALITLLVAVPALAQFNAPIRYNEGPGLKLSDSLVFHPGIAVEGRYDSNVFYAEDNTRGAPYMRLIGHLHLATLPPQRLTDGAGKVSKQTVDFRLKTAVSFREYFSDVPAVKDQRALEVDAGIGLTLFPEGMFSFSLIDDFARTVTAPNAEIRDTFTRDTNRATARFKLTPGGGRLSFALGYSFNIDLFENAELAGLNRLYHEIALNSKWKILPKSAIVLDISEQIYDYYDKGGSNFGFVKNDSYPFRVSAGFVGLITPRLSAIVKLGYGNSFHPSGTTSYSMILATAELGYQFSPFAKLRFGYNHDFYDSLFGNYFTDEKIYLRYDHMIASRFLLHLDGSYRYRDYGGLEGVPNVTELTAHVVALGLGFDWQIKEWIYVGIGYDLQLNNVASGPKNVNIFAADYSKHQVFGKVGVSY